LYPIKKAPSLSLGAFSYSSALFKRIEITSFLQQVQQLGQLELAQLLVLAQLLELLVLLLVQQELAQLQLVLLVQQELLLLSCHKRPKQQQTKMRSELNFSCLFLLGSRTRRRFKRLF
jgi:hypothetical protein